MMTARSIVPMLALVVVLAGCLIMVPTAADDSSGETDAGAIYDSVLKRIGKGGTAGASLELDEKEVMDLIRTIVLSLPDDAIEGIDFVEYVRTTDSPSFGGFIENTNDVCRSFDIDAEGGLYILVSSKSTDGGFEYDIKVRGEIDEDCNGVLESVDPKNPSKDLFEKLGVKGTADARILLKTDKDLVPQEVTANLKARIALSSEQNYSFDYVLQDTDEGTSYVPVYSLTDRTESEQSLDIEADLHMSVDGLTKGDIKGLFGPSSGGGENNKHIVLAFGSKCRNDEGMELISGVECVGSINLSKIVGNYLEDVAFDDVKGVGVPTDSEEVYFLMQRILAESGLYVSEQDYRTVLNALRNVKASLRSGDLEYFYETANSRYSSSAGLAEKIGDKVNGCPDTKVVRISSGDCELVYSKGYWDRYVGITGHSENQNIPDSIFGYEVLKGEPEDEPYSNIWFDSSNHSSVALRQWNENTFIVLIRGEKPTDGFDIAVGGDSSSDLKKLVEVEASDSKNSFAWYLKISVSDSYKFFGKELMISCGDETWTLEFTTQYDGGTLYIEGNLIFELYESGNAQVVGAISNKLESVSIPSKLQYQGKEYEVYHVSMKGLSFDKISVTTGTMVELPDCSVEEIVFKEGNSNFIDVSFVDRMTHLGKLSFEGERYSTWGDVTRDGWTGPGRTISFDGIDYTLQYRDGQLAAEAEISKASGNVVIPSKIVVDGNDVIVYSVSIRNSSIDKLDIDAISSLYLYDTKVQKLSLESNAWIRTYDGSEIIEIVFDNSDTIHVQCSILAQINGLERITISGSVKFLDDIEAIKDKLSYVTIDVDGIRYLKDEASKTLTFLEVRESDITIRGTIYLEGVTYKVNPFDLGRVRDIKVVNVSSFPVGGVDFWMSSVEEVYFNNTEKLDVPSSAFSSCDRLTTVVFDGPIGVIGNHAFDSSTELKILVFKNTIDEIGYYAFPAIGGIKTLAFEKDVGAVRSNAFGGMNDLQSVHFKEDVGVIESNAFRECPSLEEVTIHGDVGELNGFSECNSFTELYVGGDVGTIPTGAFQYSPYTTDGEVKKKMFSIVLGENSRITSIEGFAFKDIYLSQETIDSLLRSSTYVAVTAFCNVITDKGEDVIRYCGISSNMDSFSSDDSEICYDYNLYIEDRKVSINIIGIRPYGGSNPTQIEIPKELSIDGTPYPVTSLFEGTAYHSDYHFDELIIKDNVKHIGDLISRGLANLKNIVIEDNDGFGVEMFASGSDSLQMLYLNAGNGSKEFICAVGSIKAETFTVPSGFDEFNLYWLEGSEIKNLVIGDGIRTVNLGFDSIEGIETITFGKDVERIDGVPSDTIEKFIVATGNSHFVVFEDALYQMDEISKTASLLVYAPAKSGDATIPEKIGEYTVVDIDYSAFWYSKLDKVTLPDSVTSLYISSFNRSTIKEVVVSDSIGSIIGQYYVDSGSEGHPIALQDVHSKNGTAVFTVDGAIYLNKSDGTLKLVEYLGDESVLVVKEGTTEAHLSYLKAKNLSRIILPQDLRWLNVHYGYDDSTDSRVIHVLMPKDAFQSSNFYGIHFLIRTYSTSDDYDIAFASGDSGLTVSTKAKDYASISNVRMGSYTVGTAPIAWDTLFPAPTSDMSRDYVYADPIEVSYTVNEYTIAFVTDSVDSLSEQKVLHGNAIGALRSPSKANMRFTGWYTDKECTTLYDLWKPVTSDMTLYAGWTSLDSQVTVYTCEGIEYVLLGEFGFYDGKTGWLPYGTYELRCRLDYGYTGNPIVEVDGRYVGTTVTISDDKVDIMVTGFEKEWYDVRFVNNVSRGTADTTPKSVEFEGTMSLPTVSARDGYEFVGWTDGLLIVDQGYRFTKDTVLTAAYVRTASNDYYQDEFTITLNVPSNGTLATAGILKGDKGDTIALPTVVPASGYRFNGWIVDGSTVAGSYMVLGDATLTASITRISDAPSTPVQPEKPREDVKQNEDGSTTVTVKNEDGSTTSTTTKTESDGSTTVKEEKVDKDGNRTGTSTTTTNADGSSVKKEEVLERDGNATSTTTTTTDRDGSSTKLEESRTENGSSVKEERFDSSGNSQGSTTKVTETVVSDSGSTIETEKVTTADGSGRTMDEVTSVKAESADGKVRTEALVEKRNDGTVGSSATTTVKAESEDGRIEVAHEDVEAALKQMDEVVAATGEVERRVIEIGTSVRSDETEVSIPPESLKSISDSGAEVRIAGDSGTITMGSDVSKSLADRSSEGTVSVSIGKADRAAMSSVQQDVVGDSVVLQLRASVGDESVHELGGTVKVTVPYVLAPGEDPDLVRVYYVDDDGRLHMKLSSYDPVTGTVSFETDHFSYYMIGQAVEEESDDGGEDRTVAIIAGLAVIVIAVVAARVILAGREN